MANHGDFSIPPFTGIRKLNKGMEIPYMFFLRDDYE